MCSPEPAPFSLHPLAPGLNAYTLQFDPGLLAPLQDDFERTVRPWLLTPRGQQALRGGRVLQQVLPGRHYAAFSYNDYPLLWIAHHRPKELAPFQRLFRTLQLDLLLQPQIQPAHRVRFYAGFFVVGNRAPQALWHDDYAQAASGYTLITPLYPLEPGQGHLLYRTTAGQTASYTYRPGEAILLGAGFSHSTEPYAPGEHLRVLLSLTMGSDRIRDWPLLAPTIGRQARCFQLPCGHLQGRCICLLKRRLQQAFKSVL